MSIASELELPDLRPDPWGAAPADVHVGWGSVPEHLDSPALVGPAYEADETSFLLTTPQLRCLVRGGKEILVEPVSAAAAATVWTIVQGSGMAALCYQRGLVPFSATALEVDGGAVMLAGASGSGKSTLGAFLTRRGHSLLSEDLTAVRAEPRPVVGPGLQRLRLWRDVVDLLELDPESLDGDREGLQRYRLDPPRTCDRELPLERVYVLRAIPDRPPGHFQRLRRLEAIEALAEMTILPALSPVVLGAVAEFRGRVSVVNHTVIQGWERNQDFSQIEEHIRALESDWSTPGD